MNTKNLTPEELNIVIKCVSTANIKAGDSEFFVSLLKKLNDSAKIDPVEKEKR